MHAHQVAAPVVGEDTLAVGIEVATVGTGKEVTRAGRDVDAAPVDGNAEGMSGCRHGREDTDIADGGSSVGIARRRRADAWTKSDRRGRRDEAEHRPPSPASMPATTFARPMPRVLWKCSV